MSIPSLRWLFYLYLDEVQTYDGATSGNLAALFEETGKFGVRISAYNQNPERLTADDVQRDHHQPLAPDDDGSQRESGWRCSHASSAA